MSKYSKLISFLEKSNESQISLTFSQIEDIIESPLPVSVSKEYWWTNLENRSLMNDYWKISDLNISIKRVSFIKTDPLEQNKSINKKMQEFDKRWNIDINSVNEFEQFKNRLINKIRPLLTRLSNNNEVVELFHSIHGLRMKVDNVFNINSLYEEAKEDYGLNKYFINSNNLLELTRFLYSLFIVLNSLDLIVENAELFIAVENALNFSRNPLISISMDINTAEVTIYPSGAKILDDEVVNVALNWLTYYPEVSKIFNQSLKDYLLFDGTDTAARSIYDNLRASLEKLIKLVLNNNRSLENNKNDLKSWLKDNGVHPNLTNMLSHIINEYCYFMNDVKHVSNYSGNDLEFMIYQTAIIIRMICEKA